MHRVKRIEYDEDDIYSDEEEETTGNDEYTEADRTNFATLTPVVRAEVEEAGLQASDREIEDALWHYYWDVGKSVAYLKNSRTPRPQQEQKGGKKEKAKSRFDEAAERNKEKTAAGTTKPTKRPADNALAKKTEALQLDTPTTTPAQPKVKSKGLDVPRLWAESNGRRKAAAAFVVIGHVDHGKSTLMGRLLLDTGAVAQRDIDKYKKQAADLGKSSFALAWVMDTGSEERERGVTVDIAQHPFQTDTIDFTILDAPGHRDFVPNMLAGASMADLAVLVVDANHLDLGTKGQTREHILLAKACGIRRVVVAVNKLDATLPRAWDEEIFRNVDREISKLLTEFGFTNEDIAFVPVSGLMGMNVVKPAPTSGDTAWISKTSSTLLQQLERMSSSTSPTEDSVKAPLHLQITDVFRGSITNPLSISGRLTSGNVQIGDTVLIQPSGEKASIRGLEVAGEAIEWVVANDLATLHLSDIDPVHLRAGDEVCSTQDPVPVVKTLIAKLTSVESLLPMGVDVHVGRLHVPGSIAAFISVLDERGEVSRKKPRVVKAGEVASVKIGLAEGVPLGVGDRIVLRSGGSTVAYGVVERVAAGGK